MHWVSQKYSERTLTLPVEDSTDVCPCQKTARIEDENQRECDGSPVDGWMELCRKKPTIASHSYYQRISTTVSPFQLVTMKYFLAAALICHSVGAFTVAPAQRAATMLNAEYEPMEGEGKINLKIDLDSPKVATMEDLEKGKKVYCRCW